MKKPTEEMMKQYMDIIAQQVNDTCKQFSSKFALNEPHFIVLVRQPVADTQTAYLSASSVQDTEDFMSLMQEYIELAESRESPEPEIRNVSDPVQH